MLNEILFNDISSMNDLNFYVASVNIGAPTVKVRQIDVPYANGILDLTDYYGSVVYGNRTITITGLIKDNISETYETVLGALNGKYFDAITIDGNVYSGRCSVGDMTITKAGLFQITCNCKPDTLSTGVMTNISFTLDTAQTVYVVLALTQNAQVRIFWGDGATETVTGSGRTAVGHAYEDAGDKRISLKGIRGKYALYSDSSIGAQFLAKTETVESYTDTLRTKVTQVSYNDEACDTILDGGFYGCNVMEVMSANHAMTSYSTNATFNLCRSLVSILPPSDITEFGDKMFQNCENLKQLEIPEAVTSIANNALNGCRQIKSFTIPAAITSIGAGFFRNCSSLESVIFKGNTGIIGNLPFSNCLLLTLIDYSAATAVPELRNASYLSSIPESCVILVPADLYDEWIAAANWSDETVVGHIRAVE